MKNNYKLLVLEEYTTPRKKWTFLKIFLYFIACAILGCALGSYYARTFRAEPKQEVSADPLAEKYSEDGDMVQYPDSFTVKKTSGEMDLYLRNPQRCGHSIRADVYLQGTLLAETGWLKPGSQRTRFQVTDKFLLDDLEPGSYSGSIEIQSLEGGKAGDSVLMPVTICVTDESTENAEALEKSFSDQTN